MRRCHRVGRGRAARLALTAIFLLLLLLQSGAAAADGPRSEFDVDVSTTVQEITWSEPIVEPPQLRSAQVALDSPNHRFVSIQVGAVYSECAVQPSGLPLAAEADTIVFNATPAQAIGYQAPAEFVLAPESASILVRVGTPICGWSEPATTARSYAVEWGLRHNFSLQAGELLEMRLGALSVPDAPSDALFVVRVWDVEEGQGVVVPVGLSYRPSIEVTAAWEVVRVAQDNLTGLAAGAAIAAASASAWKSHRWKEWDLPLPWPLVGLFTRLRAPRLLDHKTRRLLQDAVEADPGIRFTELRRRTGLAIGVMTHHLTILEDHGLLRTVYRGRQRHLYPAAAAPSASETLTEIQRQILAELEDGSRSQREIARRLGISQQAVSYHARRLREDGLLGTGSSAEVAAGAARARPLFDPRVLLARPNVRGAGAMT